MTLMTRHEVERVIYSVQKRYPQEWIKQYIAKYAHMLYMTQHSNNSIAYNVIGLTHTFDAHNARKTLFFVPGPTAPATDFIGYAN